MSRLIVCVSQNEATTMHERYERLGYRPFGIFRDSLRRFCFWLP